MNLTMLSIRALSTFIFQFPITKNFLWLDILKIVFLFTSVLGYFSFQRALDDHWRPKRRRLTYKQVLQEIKNVRCDVIVFASDL